MLIARKMCSSYLPKIFIGENVTEAVAMFSNCHQRECSHTEKMLLQHFLFFEKWKIELAQENWTKLYSIWKRLGFGNYFGKLVKKLGAIE